MNLPHKEISLQEKSSCMQHMDDSFIHSFMGFEVTQRGWVPGTEHSE